MRIGIFLASTLMAVVSAADSATAGGQTERLYSKGLAAFHQQDRAAAFEWFDAAVAADPEDSVALYYRGVTRGHLGDFEAAVVDLEAALALQPQLGRIRAELGYCLLRSERYEDALIQLGELRSDPVLGPRASLFSGVANLRLGRFDRAREELDDAAAGDPALASTASYYRGVLEARAGSTAMAAERFESVVEEAPDTELSRAAREYLDQIRSGDAGARLRLHGALGFEYDSNVSLSPDDEELSDDLGFSDEGDGRVTLTAGADYTLWQGRSVRVSTGYSFNQSLHFDLDEFDVQTHRFELAVSAEAGVVDYGVVARYDYVFVDTESFEREPGLMPWIRVRQGGVGYVEGFYRARDRDFIDEPFSARRDGVHHLAGLRQTFYLDPKTARWPSAISTTPTIPTTKAVAASSPTMVTRASCCLGARDRPRSACVPAIHTNTRTTTSVRPGARTRSIPGRWSWREGSPARCGLRRPTPAESTTRM